jgi:hypothetical protein
MNQNGKASLHLLDFMVHDFSQTYSHLKTMLPCLKVSEQFDQPWNLSGESCCW